MKISEIFYSIQGEGSLVGVPSVFVRTSGCNLRCVGATRLTLLAPEGEDWPLGRILETVDSFRATHVVVTGGEPMIAPQIGDLTKQLHERGLHITIETAGTVNTPVACDLMSISPKLKNSTPLEREGGRWAQQHDRLRWQPAVIKELIATYPYQLKFVIADPPDLAEVNQIRETLGTSAIQHITHARRHHRRSHSPARPLARRSLQRTRLPFQPAPSCRPLGQQTRRLKTQTVADCGEPAIG